MIIAIVNSTYAVTVVKLAPEIRINVIQARSGFEPMRDLCDIRYRCSVLFYYVQLDPLFRTHTGKEMFEIASRK